MEGMAGLPGKETEYAAARLPLVRDWQRSVPPYPVRQKRGKAYLLGE